MEREQGRQKQIKVGWNNFMIRFIVVKKVTKSKFSLGKQFAVLKGSRIFILGQRGNWQCPQIVIYCNFWTVCPTDLYLIFLEMAAHFTKLGWDVSQVFHLVPPPLNPPWTKSFLRFFVLKIMHKRAERTLTKFLDLIQFSTADTYEIITEALLFSYFEVSRL